MKRQNWVYIVVICVYVFYVESHGQSSLLRSGPMVGYSQMREVMLWVQTTTEAQVKIKYWEKNNVSRSWYTEEVTTSKIDGYTAKLLADSVQPGKIYSYELYINGKPEKIPHRLEFQSQKLWQHREDPPDFKVALGSCAFINDSIYDRPGKPYGGGYSIFNSILSKKPDMMLWLGDNIYLREADWGSRTGFIYRYTHARSLPELQPLLGSVHHYALWDDHDYGPNDADRSFIHKSIALECFMLFWANPTFGFYDIPCATTMFEWGDVHFFLLDNRYFRAPNNSITGDRSYLGRAQLQWLVEALKYSKAPFKMVAIGGQTINPLQVYENYSNYKEERDTLLSLISKENISGVFFLSGDRHHTILTKLERKNQYPLYDLTVSPLTSSPPRKEEFSEKSEFMVANTLVLERNFAVLEFSGKRKERQMKISVYNVDGKILWEKTIKESELK
ncbi:MAG: alkaline phosphatase family protein [Cytophagaceae bacterium]|nr:alkaline phosphatase family protein [Cytophagaceae bacterium]MDW8455666.1 alkaline phosphatase D family protein [Cytophagaceae bacterium]